MAVSEIQLEQLWPGRYFETLPGLPGNGWFLTEITPTPLSDQIISVTSDIMNNRFTNVNQGRLYHSSKCTCNSHSLPNKIKQAVKVIPETSFKLAIFSGDPLTLNGQPIAIPIDPPINRDLYPDHPHLNFPSRINIQGKKIVIPETLCYIKDPSKLGTDKIERLDEALIHISMWLYRHQVWLKTREQKKPGIWIGPQDLSGLTPESYALTLNPFSLCRCGKNEMYLNCHLPQDIQAAQKTPLKNPVNLIRRNVFLWNEMLGKPQAETFNKLKTAWSRFM